MNAWATSDMYHKAAPEILSTANKTDGSEKSDGDGESDQSDEVDVDGGESEGPSDYSGEEEGFFC